MKKISREQVLKDYNKLKIVARKYTQRNNYEKALRTIFVAAGFMYTYSQIYFDDEMEQLIKIIGNNLYLNISKREDEPKKIMFYDGFGNDRRGLALIYLRALKELDYDIEYVTYQEFSGTINEISKLLGEQEIIYLKEKSVVRQIYELNNIINQKNICQVLLYMCPDDVVATTVFSQYEGVIERYLVNLTDHAFWIGKEAFDYCIEFRSYGGNVSYQERKIELDKIFCLPFYPNVTPVKFQGFPFESESEKIIFSGGALYKTKGMNNLYYKMIEKIIQMDKEIIFYYVGEGDCRELNKLIEKYPKQVFYSHERADFYEIMKRCYFYLSTYPYFGGLMTQYAIMAGKLPITLASKDVIGEQTVETDNIWYFETTDELYQETEKLLNDKEYLNGQEAKLKNTIITAEKYAKELESILENKKQNGYEVKWEEVNIKKIKTVILERSNWGEYCGYFCRVKAPFLLWKFPIKFICGFFANIYNQKKQKNQNK